MRLHRLIKVSVRCILLTKKKSKEHKNERVIKTEKGTFTPIVMSMSGGVATKLIDMSRTVLNCCLKPMLFPGGPVLLDFEQTSLFNKIKAMILGPSVERYDCMGVNIYTRGKEHLNGMDRAVSQSVLRTHANDCHNGVIPDYVMNVTGVYHGDAMLRQITESIKIRREGSINNKTEWNTITLPQAAIVK